VLVESYISLDLEMTGLHPKTDRIIEVGAVKVINGKIVDRIEMFINPGRKLSEQVVELTGIQDSDLVGMETIHQKIREILAFIGDLPLVGHNILFDYSFLKKAAVDEKLKFEKKGIDTLSLARIFLSSLPQKTLPKCCAYFGIEYVPHRALADALATKQLYEQLCAAYANDDKFAPKELHYNVKKDTPITSKQKEQIRSLMSRYSIVLDFDLELCTRSEASRFIDKTLATYARSLIV